MPKDTISAEYGRRVAMERKRHEEYQAIHPEDKTYRKAGWHIGLMHMYKKWPTPEQINLLDERERKQQDEIVTRKQDNLKQKEHDKGNPTMTPRKMRKATPPK